MTNEQIRKWIGVINNPQEINLDHEMIRNLILEFNPTYFCMADEIAKTGMFHTHIFVYSRSPMRFTTIKRRFPTAHIERAYGSAEENREYILKAGKWADTDKADTIVEGSFYEWGQMPTKKQEDTPDIAVLIELLKEGKTTAEIVKELPKYALRLKDVNLLRQEIIADIYATKMRDVKVYYVYGPEEYRSKYIYDNHDTSDIYRIVTYGKNGVQFDRYSAEDVLVFEEFDSRKVSITSLINWLGEYPVMLPARYADKTACYTRVYITSSVYLTEHYTGEQLHQTGLYKAFLNKIDEVIRFDENGNMDREVIAK